MLRGPMVATPPLVGMLVAFALIAAWTCAGRKLVLAIGPRGLERFEAIAFGGAVGLGVGGTLVAAFGLAGWLTPGAIAAVAVAWGAFAFVPGSAPDRKEPAGDEP